jgi:DNA repair exonuclease SbcCD ATPase subunit
MKRLRIIQIGRHAIRLSIVVLLILLTGCERLDKIEMRLDIVDRRMVTLSEKIKACDTAAKIRSDKNESAILQLDDKLTEEIKAYNTASQKRSAENQAAIHQLDNKLMSHIASQRQELNQENINLKKNLEALKVELAQLIQDVSESKVETQLALEKIETASKEDVTQLIQDINERYTNTQRILSEITKTSAEAVEKSSEVRTAMRKLIKAHASYFEFSAKLVRALEAEKTQVRPDSSKNMLDILYKQSEAQKKLLNEMQNILPKVRLPDNAPNNVE